VERHPWYFAASAATNGPLLLLLMLLRKPSVGGRKHAPLVAALGHRDLHQSTFW